MSPKISDYICQGSRLSLVQMLTLDEINLDYIKEHIEGCSFCKEGLQKIISKNFNPINIFHIIKQKG